MARPKGRNRIPRMINRELEIDQLISRRRLEDPSFNVSDVDNDLWREYFKMKGDNVELDLKELEAEESDLQNKLTIIEYKRNQMTKIKEKKEAEKKKKIKNVFKDYKVIG